jgi:hypothetical protein
MNAEDAYRAAMEALRRAEQRADESERALTRLRAEFDALLDVLVGKEVLTDGHRRMFEKVAGRHEQAIRPRVRLHMFIDKYQMENQGPDCRSLLHICHARCCSLTFELTEQDVAEQRVLWEVGDPYRIHHEVDNYCSHLDRDTGDCTVHEHRPATCRGFDCRGDKRIWIDFENKIPAPPPPGIAMLKTRPVSR